MKFKLGLIGAGNIARAHVAAVESLASQGLDVGIVAVVDPSEPARTALARDVQASAYADFKAMLSQSSTEDRPDALVVCTPPSARIEVVAQALEAGIPVLIEKPPAHTVAHVQQLIALSQSAPQLPCLVGFCHRFTPAVHKIVQLCNDGEIGDIVRFENTFAANLPHLRDAWMSDPTLSGGGSLIDTGLHSLDLFSHLFGPARVEGAVLRHGWAGRGESNATLLLTSTPGSARIQQPAGVAGVIACGWAESTRFEVAVIGTKGTLRYDFENACVLQHTGSDGSQQNLEVQTHEVRFAEQLRAFIELCQTANTSKPVCTIDESLGAMQLVAQASALNAGRERDEPDNAATLTPHILQRQPAAAPVAAATR